MALDFFKKKTPKGEIEEQQQTEIVEDVNNPIKEHPTNDAQIPPYDIKQKTTEDHSQPAEEKIDIIIQQLRTKEEKNKELCQKIEQLELTIREKDAKLKTLSKQAKTIEGGTSEKEDNDSQPSEEQSDSKIIGIDKLTQQTIKIYETLETRVKELIVDRNELSQKLEERVNRYEELVNNIQEDRYRKDKVKILRRIINLRNLVFSVLDDYRYETPRLEGHETPAAIFLEQQLSKITEKLDADLRQEMLIPLVKGVEGSEFDAEHQEIIERQPTDHPELDGKVYRSVAPGYIWTLPYIFKPRVNETGEEIHTYKFLLRSEDVVTYKYEKNNENKL